MFKDRPLKIHELARPAHEAARCAGAAGQYWAYHDRLFEVQPRFEPDALVEYAVELGIDREGFAACLREGRFARAVDEDLAVARALGITSTPTFLINGRILVGNHPVETFRAVIDGILSGTR